MIYRFDLNNRWVNLKLRSLLLLLLLNIYHWTDGHLASSARAQLIWNYFDYDRTRMLPIVWISHISRSLLFIIIISIIIDSRCVLIGGTQFQRPRQMYEPQIIRNIYHFSLFTLMNRDGKMSYECVAADKCNTHRDDLKSYLNFPGKLNCNLSRFVVCIQREFNCSRF